MFDKLEQLVRDMQDNEHGVPVRSQKMFLTSIPAAFMGYDLIEWLMDRLSIEDSCKGSGQSIDRNECLAFWLFGQNPAETVSLKPYPPRVLNVYLYVQCMDLGVREFPFIPYQKRQMEKLFWSFAGSTVP